MEAESLSTEEITLAKEIFPASLRLSANRLTDPPEISSNTPCQAVLISNTA